MAYEKKGRIHIEKLGQPSKTTIPKIWIFSKKKIFLTSNPKNPEPIWALKSFAFVIYLIPIHTPTSFKPVKSSSFFYYGSPNMEKRFENYEERLREF